MLKNLKLAWKEAWHDYLTRALRHFRPYSYNHRFYQAMYKAIKDGQAS